MPRPRAQCPCQAPDPGGAAPSVAALDSGTAPAAQSAMPSIAARSRTDGRQPSTGATASGRLDPQSRISTSLTDVTQRESRRAQKRTYLTERQDAPRYGAGAAKGGEA